VYQDPEAGEELSSLQDALWAVVGFLSAGGSKHDPERIWITTHTQAGKEQADEHVD
jgi:hypothetical protein